MNKHERHPNGKAKKWIETRYSKPYRIRRAIKVMQARSILMMGLSQVQAIRSTSFAKPISKAGSTSKQIAIATTLVNTFAAVNEVLA